MRLLVAVTSLETAVKIKITLRSGRRLMGLVIPMPVMGAAAAVAVVMSSAGNGVATGERDGREGE